MESKLRIMIVDDEYIVREDLKSLIDWEAAGFEIVCEAGNGRQGIAYYREYHPDLIIADIKMPVKDGLQMAEEILASGSEPEFLLLTAYDEFDFARKAMKMSITHYLLKDEIEAPVLEELLKEIRLKIRQKQERRRQNEGAVLRELLTGGHPAQAIETGACYCAFLLVKMRVGEIPLETIVAGMERSRYLELTHVMESGEFSVFFLRYSRLSELLYRSETADLARRISLSMNTAAALSGRVGGPDEILPVFEECCRSFEAAVFFRGGRGVILPETPVDSTISHGSVSAQVFILKECLRRKNYTVFIESLENYLHEQCLVKNRGAQFLFAKPFFIGALEEYNESRCLIDKRAFDTLRADGEDMYLFEEKVRSVVEKMRQAEEGALSRNMRRVVRFIEEHYGENIGLEDVAGILSMNAMYAGQLFKKELGKSFKQYLCELRISRAKELLLSGSYKIYEVGEMVGYQSTQYFSSIFKKETGLSPGDFIAANDKPS